MTLTYAQRLALDHRERTNGYEDDPSLAEQHELDDEAFRHFDTYTFQFRARGQQAAGIGARGRGAVSSSSDDGGPATICPPGDMESPAHAPAPEPVGSEAGAGSPTPSGDRPGLASSVERWMWTA